MATIESQSCTFKVGDGASPESYNAVGQVVNIDGPDGAASVIDVSSLASTRREKKMGLPDEGRIALSLQYDPDDTGQTRCTTLRNGRTAGNFRIELSDSPATTWSFSGYVLEFSKSINIDQVVMGSIVVEITGSVTEA